MGKYMRKKRRMRLVLTWRDAEISCVIMVLTIGLTFFMNYLSKGAETFVPMIFLFAVFLISLWTNGYLYGIVASILGVFFVNYVFTYPYFSLDFTIEGYPITFSIMIAVAILTSTMTSNLKKHDKLLIEIEKEKMKTNLLRAISHDLRTPLTSIIGSINTVIDNYEVIEFEKIRRLLRDAKDDAEWLVRLVENILLVTKMNAGEAKLHLRDEVVEEIVAEAVQKFHKHFAGQKVCVQVPDEYLIVPMDGILIEEVLNNLLENSVKHSNNIHKIDLTVIKEEDFAVFTVRDYGQGFSDEQLSKLFDGFSVSSTNENSDGSKNMGIGLSLCSTIIAAHQGTMSASNSLDGGAMVSFSLPLRKE